MTDVVSWLTHNEPEFNERRLPSLYSDLVQQKAANPDGFAANATAWQKALTRAALADQLPGNSKLVLKCTDGLLHALSSPKYGQPTGLGAVFDEMVQKGKAMDIKDFQGSEASIYQKSWSLGSIVRWGLRQAGLWKSGSWENNGKLRRGELVLIEGLERLAKQISAQQKGQESFTDRVMSKESFSEVVSHTDVGTLSTHELEVLLRYLSRDVPTLSYDADTVKFKSSTTDGPDPITEEDRHIANVKTTLSSLQAQVDSLSLRAETLQKTAQNAVQAKNRNTALSALKSKKLAETALQQRRDMLHQLEGVYSKIEQAVDQAQFLQVMQASATTLKTLNQRVGGVERVDAIMDDLREQVGQTDEVGRVMQEPLSDNAIVDEAEVDDELASMEREELARKEGMKEDASKTKLEDLAQFERAAKERAAADRQRQAEDQELDAELESSSQRLERIKLTQEPETT